MVPSLKESVRKLKPFTPPGVFTLGLPLSSVI
jgi:hypothetical protein